MVRLFIVVVFIILILLIFRNYRNKSGTNKSDIYKKIILILIVGVILFFLATSGKFIIPQLLQLLKVTLPFLTKFIGI